MPEMPEFRGIIRVAGKDLKGELALPVALLRIKGIGINFADTIAEIAAKELGISKLEKIGNFSDEQLKKLEDIIANAANYNIPTWMVNRRNDSTTGKSTHLIMSDLDFQQKLDITGQKNIRSYRGIRHMYGLPVRGQRTRTMGRKGMTLGVIRGKEKPAAAGEGKGEKKGKGK